MKQFEIRELFARAGIGQDGTGIRLYFETSEEADTAFEYLCKIESMLPPWAYYVGMAAAFIGGLGIGAAVYG